MDTVAIFVNVRNIYYTVKERHGPYFDYGAFLRETTVGRKLVKAIAYATDKKDSGQSLFQGILRRMRFEVKLPPYIQRADWSTKGDWDAGIAVVVDGVSGLTADSLKQAATSFAPIESRPLFPIPTTL